VVSFAVLRAGGRLVDRAGAPTVAALGTVLFLGVLAFGLAWPQPFLPVLFLFAAFMTANSLRNVSATTLSSRVPGPSERARFLSTQSAVQHIASAVGATLSTRVLRVEPDGRLAGMRTLVAGSALVASLLPFLLAAVSARLRERERERRAAVAGPPAGGAGTRREGAPVSP